jgi:hypothetical protein
VSRYEQFDRTQLKLEDLSKRGHDLTIDAVCSLDQPFEPYEHPEYAALIDAIVTAREQGRPVIAFLGGHPIKLGLSRYLIDLMQRGAITHLATNGAGVIHDFELASGGGTSENVPKWIRVGQFGLWQQTSRLNDAINLAAERGEGLGEGVGRVIQEEAFPHRDVSLAANAWQLGIPFTSHVGVGSDIIHSHPNCDGAALGATSYTDFLIFARTVQDLEGGVFLNIGSAVAGPEVYLKALSMARNVAQARGQQICHFVTAVFDLVELPEGFREGPPGKDHPQYYYRPWKTILVRTVADGGQSYYFSGDHSRTLPTLWRALKNRLPRRSPAATAGETPAGR